MKKVVISGIYKTFARTELAEILKGLGADLNTTVSKKTDFLIAGENTGPSKLKKMKLFVNENLSKKIIEETELINMLKPHIRGLIS